MHHVIVAASLSILQLLIQKTEAQVFTVSGTKLLDANGNEFIIRGINNPHSWHYDRAMKDLKELADMKVNCIRIVWETKDSPAKLHRIIKKCVALQMIPMVELHDAPGDTTIQRLLSMAAYFVQPGVKKVLLPYERYLLINIANEWGNHNMTAEFWKESYKQVVTMFRDAGYKTTLVIDAPGWGQDINAIQQYGKELLEYDPLHNLLFSVHMYHSWNDPLKIDKELQKTYDLSLPLVVGEFGYNFDNGHNNLKCKVDHTIILKKCHELHYGYIPWMWTGNNKENAWLDLSEFHGNHELTWWGRQVFETEYGIRKNAKKATVFQQETK
jgi:mannan endo-1,4-beta-mannosidase